MVINGIYPTVGKVSKRRKLSDPAHSIEESSSPGVFTSSPQSRLFKRLSGGQRQQQSNAVAQDAHTKTTRDIEAVWKKTLEKAKEVRRGGSMMWRSCTTCSTSSCPSFVVQPQSVDKAEGRRQSDPRTELSPCHQKEKGQAAGATATATVPPNGSAPISPTHSEQERMHLECCVCMVGRVW